MSLVLGIVKFKGANRAQEVLDGYLASHPGDVWANQAGIIERHKLGRISVHSNYGVDWDGENAATAEGMGVGGMTGLLIGLIAGPVGAAAGGLLGGALGGIAAAADETDQPLYDVIRGKLEKGTSAILLLADDRVIDKMLAELGPLGVDKMRRNVREELRGRLEEAVRQVARSEAQPTAH